MDAAERTWILEQLRATRDLFIASLESVSQGQAKFKISPDQWSIEEVAEHVAIAERGMYRLISEHYELLDTPAERTREQTFLSPIRGRRMEAPERVRPKGRYSTLSEALEQFKANRERTIQYVESCDDDLRMRVTNHVVGRISGQECLMLLIAHPARHAEQIRQIKRSPAYPV